MWVKSVALTVWQLLPIYPNKRTISAFTGISQRCQSQIFGWRYCARGRPFDYSPSRRSMTATKAVLNRGGRPVLGGAANTNFCIKSATIFPVATKKKPLVRPSALNRLA